MAPIRVFGTEIPAAQVARAVPGLFGADGDATTRYHYRTQGQLWARVAEGVKR